MSIWKQPLTLEILQKRQKNSLSEHLGIVFTEIGDSFLKATMPVNEATRQPYGILHGGASAALAETVASIGANYCLASNQGRCVGMEININHLRPVSSGWVVAKTYPLHIGKKTQVWQIEISKEKENHLIAVGRMTAAVISPSS